MVEDNWYKKIKNLKINGCKVNKEKKIVVMSTIIENAKTQNTLVLKDLGVIQNGSSEC